MTNTHLFDDMAGGVGVIVCLEVNGGLDVTAKHGNLLSGRYKRSYRNKRKFVRISISPSLKQPSQINNIKHAIM